MFFFFDHNFRIGRNVFFIFVNILCVINFTNTILTFKKLTNTIKKVSWVVQNKLALKKKIACYRKKLYCVS